MGCGGAEVELSKLGALRLRAWCVGMGLKVCHKKMMWHGGLCGTPIPSLYDMYMYKYAIYVHAFVAGIV